MPLAFARGSGPIRAARSRRRNGSEEVEKREGWFRDTQAMASGCRGVPGVGKAEPIVPPQTWASELGRAPARARFAPDDPQSRLVLPRQKSFASLHILTRRASEGSEALPSLARRVRMSFFGARVIRSRPM